MGYSRIIQYIYNIAKGRGIDFNFADGMICDWKNEREYRLLGYISHMSENIADGYLQ